MELVRQTLQNQKGVILTERSEVEKTDLGF